MLYFVDLYANWYDVQLAEAFVAVLEHNNIAVYVHPDQQPSGMDRISLGDVERARKSAARNVRAAGRGGAAGLRDRLHRAVRRALPDARVSQPARRRRRHASSPPTRTRPAPTSGDCTRPASWSSTSSR